MRKRKLILSGLTALAVLASSACSAKGSNDTATPTTNRPASSSAAAKPGASTPPNIKVPVGESKPRVPSRFPDLGTTGSVKSYVQTVFSIMAERTLGENHPMPVLKLVNETLSCRVGKTKLKVGDGAPNAPVIQACRAGDGLLIVYYGPVGVIEGAAGNADNFTWNSRLIRAYQDYLAQLSGKVAPASLSACNYGRIIGGLKQAGYVSDAEAQIEPKHLEGQGASFRRGRDTGAC